MKLKELVGVSGVVYFEDGLEAARLPLSLPLVTCLPQLYGLYLWPCRNCKARRDDCGVYLRRCLWEVVEVYEESPSFAA